MVLDNVNERIIFGNLNSMWVNLDHSAYDFLPPSPHPPHPNVDAVFYFYTVYHPSNLVDYLSLVPYVFSLWIVNNISKKFI